MRPSDMAQWLQPTLVLMLVTIPSCLASTSMERRWENSDLIIEGRIIETRTELGVQVSTVTVDKILKTRTITCEPYNKGYIEGLTLQVPASSLAPYQTLRLFLEEDRGIYRIIAAETVKNESQPSLIDPASVGLLLLIAMAVAASRRPLIAHQNND